MITEKELQFIKSNVDSATKKLFQSKKFDQAFKLNNLRNVTFVAAKERLFSDMFNNILKMQKIYKEVRNF